MERQRDEEVQQDDDQQKVLNNVIKHCRSVAKVSGKNPYTVGELDPRRKLRVGSGVRFGLSVVPKVTASHPSGKIKIADVCKAALELKDRHVILRPIMLPQRLWNAIRSCDLVVADSPWDVDVGVLTENRVVIALIIVATGVPVLPVKAWACEAPQVYYGCAVPGCMLSRSKEVCDESRLPDQLPYVVQNLRVRLQVQG